MFLTNMNTCQGCKKLTINPTHCSDCMKGASMFKPGDVITPKRDFAAVKSGVPYVIKDEYFGVAGVKAWRLVHPNCFLYEKDIMPFAAHHSSSTRQLMPTEVAAEQPDIVSKETKADRIMDAIREMAKGS